MSTQKYLELEKTIVEQCSDYQSYMTTLKSWEQLHISTRCYYWYLNYIEPKYSKLVTAVTFKLYWFIIHKSKSNSRSCVMTTRQMADKLNMSKQSVIDHLRILKLLGLIKYQGTKNPLRDRMPSRYHITEPAEQLQIEEKNAELINEFASLKRKHKIKFTIECPV